MQTEDGRGLIELLGMAQLQQLSVFGALSPQAIEFLIARGRVLRLERDEVLYQPGDPGDCFYVVLLGSLSYHQQHRGQLAYVRDVQAGEEMGFCAMIALHDRVGRPVASESSCVLEVGCALFHDLHQQMPADFGLLLLNLARGMARTLRDVGDHVAEFHLRRRSGR